MAEEMDIDVEEGGVKLAKVKKEKKEKKDKVKGDKKDKKEKDKKEKKEKKDKSSKSKSTEEPDTTEATVEKTTTESDATKESSSENPTSSPAKDLKRKRSSPDLEIDLSLPTPPSKKQLRKAKKKSGDDAAPTNASTSPAKSKSKATSTAAAADAPKPGPHATQSRTQHGIWIGNLPYTCTEASLREFFLGEQSPLGESDIVRVNLPVKTYGSRGNKGFAYVDFTSEKGVAYALTLSETEMGGRRVLIKSSSDYSGRPKKEEREKKGEDGKDATGPGGEIKRKETHGNPPSKILWVGNLPFDVTDEEIREHFSYAGGIVRVRAARFQDTGKSKGFAFIDFDSVDAARRAITGVGLQDVEALEGKEEKKMDKLRKKRMVIGGNRLKLEFGEDAQTRYKKRFGGKKREGEGAAAGDGGEAAVSEGQKAWEKRKEKKFDARKVAPGAALAAAPRLTGGIVESKGTKVTFDD